MNNEKRRSVLAPICTGERSFTKSEAKFVDWLPSFLREKALFKNLNLILLLFSKTYLISFVRKLVVVGMARRADIIDVCHLHFGVLHSS